MSDTHDFKKLTPQEGPESTLAASGSTKQTNWTPIVAILVIVGGAIGWYYFSTNPHTSRAQQLGKQLAQGQGSCEDAVDLYNQISAETGNNPVKAELSAADLQLDVASTCIGNLRKLKNQPETALKIRNEINQRLESAKALGKTLQGVNKTVLDGEVDKNALGFFAEHNAHLTVADLNEVRAQIPLIAALKSAAPATHKVRAKVKPHKEARHVVAAAKKKHGKKKAHKA